MNNLLYIHLEPNENTTVKRIRNSHGEGASTSHTTSNDVDMVKKSVPKSRKTTQWGGTNFYSEPVSSSATSMSLCDYLADSRMVVTQKLQDKIKDFR